MHQCRRAVPYSARDLALHSLGAEHQASDRDRDGDQRSERKHRVVGERRPRRASLCFDQSLTVSASVSLCACAATAVLALTTGGDERRRRAGGGGLQQPLFRMLGVMLTEHEQPVGGWRVDRQPNGVACVLASPSIKPNMNAGEKKKGWLRKFASSDYRAVGGISEGRQNNALPNQ